MEERLGTTTNTADFQRIERNFTLLCFTKCRRVQVSGWGQTKKLSWNVGAITRAAGLHLALKMLFIVPRW